MMKVMCLILISLLAYKVGAQTASEIYLFDLKISKNKMSLKNAKNVSNHKGYDNQPYFDPEKPILYYTSADTSGRTDLRSYNFSTGASASVTNSQEREYSPTVTPDKKFISCIIQRDNGTQDLGKYPVGGGQPIVIINNLTVGYHAWVDDKNLIAFILGEPNTLRWISPDHGEDSVLAENIGRSLHVIPTSGDLSFVQKSSTAWTVKKIDKRTKKITTLAETLKEREDLTWSPDGRIVMSDGQKVFFIWPETKGKWKEVEVNIPLPLNGITRMSINSRGDKMAIVVAE